jgi:hypothetical protein
MDTDFHVADDYNAHALPKPIIIGDDVMIESRVTVLRGSQIGDGARIRSGSVVSGWIPAGAVAAGVPAAARTITDEADATDVRMVAMKALNLAVLPQLSDGPNNIAEWDSFGSLKLLLALETAFGVTIGEETLRSARSLADLAEKVRVPRRSYRNARLPLGRR